MELAVSVDLGTVPIFVPRSLCSEQVMPDGAAARTQFNPVADYLQSSEYRPLFLHGDALTTLSAVPPGCIDCVLTSPPYWGQRTYKNGGLGLDKTWALYVEALLGVFGEGQRILKPTGSFWLNLGDCYANKALLGLPWRVAFALTDRQGWILRNSVIWNKV